MRPGKLRRVVINISGEIFETYERTLKSFPETLLGNMRKSHRYYCPLTKQYFFERNRQCFVAILFYYQSRGILCCPPDMAVDIFAEECRFFGISENEINAMKAKEGVLPEMKNMYVDIDQSKTKRAYLWNSIENPETSFIAKIVTTISLLAILGSVSLIVLETMDINKENRSIFKVVNIGLNIFFLLELVARFGLSPSKRAFLLKLLNWVDVASVFPFFIMEIFFVTKPNLLVFLRILRFSRVVRLIKLLKHSRRLQIVVRLLYSSLRDVELLLMCSFTIVIFIGSVMFHIESSSPDSEFDTLPNSFWWGIITITTVGYGDICPRTINGKIFAGCFMVFGILTMTLPVLAIVTRFELNYERDIDQLKERAEKLAEEEKDAMDNFDWH